MKHLVKFTFGMAVAIVLVAANASAITIADWTFETNFAAYNGITAASVGPVTPEVGSGSAFGVHANSLTYWQKYTTGNGSTNSWACNYWSIGDYFQFQVDLTGYADVTVEWDQTGPPAGPRDFILQYSTDNSTYTDFGLTNKVLQNSSPSWTKTSYSTKHHFSSDLSSVSDIENASTVYFRLVNSSSISVNGGTVTSISNTVLDNFQVSAEVIPEPSTIILVGIGLVGCVLATRRRLS